MDVHIFFSKILMIFFWSRKFVFRALLKPYKDDVLADFSQKSF